MNFQCDGNLDLVISYTIKGDLLYEVKRKLLATMTSSVYLMLSKYHLNDNGSLHFVSISFNNVLLSFSTHDVCKTIFKRDNFQIEKNELVKLEVSQLLSCEK